MYNLIISAVGGDVGGGEGDAEAMIFLSDIMQGLLTGMEVPFFCLPGLQWTSGVSWDALYTLPVLRLHQWRGPGHRDALVVTTPGPVAPVTGEATNPFSKSCVLCGVCGRFLQIIPGIKMKHFFKPSYN